MIHLKILPQHEGQRLDRYLTDQRPEFSRSRLQKLIVEGAVCINGKTTRSSYRLVVGDSITIDIPPPIDSTINPEDIPLDIFFEDDHVLVLDKPAGMIVHPAGRVTSGTLVNALLSHCTHLSGINGVLRPGIVHRLDKDTSGLMVVAKSDEGHRGLAAQLEARAMERRYLALIWGGFEADEGRIEAPIGRHLKNRKRMAVSQNGRYAATRWKIRARYDFLSLLSLALETGRTHQIRVHLTHLNRPVFGDPLYGGREDRLSGIAPLFRRRATHLLAQTNRQMLHETQLTFVDPVTKNELAFRAQPPGDMQKILADAYSSSSSSGISTNSG
ncbi:MAG: RluA family pseudouridine synthase [Gemmatimonadetes bacterium]|nr:RluA family pseudouridine synthase [Gemmatimonadota bacterium]